MGSAIGDRILAAGFPLTVYNRTAARVAPLVDAGANHAGSLGELVSASEIILTVLTDDAAVDGVYADLFKADATARLFVDASTVRASTIARLAERVRTAGAALVDAPLAGPPAAAPARQPVGVCGRSASHLATAPPG